MFDMYLFDATDALHRPATWAEPCGPHPLDSKAQQSLAGMTKRKCRERMRVRTAPSLLLQPLKHLLQLQLQPRPLLLLQVVRPQLQPPLLQPPSPRLLPAPAQLQVLQPSLRLLRLLKLLQALLLLLLLLPAVQGHLKTVASRVLSRR